MTLRIGAFLLLAAMAAAQTPKTAVVPSASDLTTRFDSATYLFSRTAVTAQALYAAAGLGQLKVGDQITGFEVRSASGSAAPSSDLTIGNFDVTIGKAAVSIGQLSPVFAGNLVTSDQLLVRTGPLTIPARSLPATGGADSYGALIEFDVPYLYTGGDLVIQLAHTGITSNNVQAVAVATVPDSRYVRSAGADTYNAGRANSGILDGGPSLRLRLYNGGPYVTSALVLNGASSGRTAVSPGMITTIYGMGLGPKTLALGGLTAGGTKFDTTAGGTKVSFDGVEGAMIYSSANQVSVVAPYSLAGKTSTKMVIESNGEKSSAVTLAVQEASPAIFTISQTGRGQGAILNQDGSVNSASNPAAPGSVIVLYATGEGQTYPAGVNGALALTSPYPRPVAQPTKVTVGGVDAPVLYSGAAPGLIAGLWQVNAQLPASIPGNLAAPVVLQVGDAKSPSSVTVAIR